MLNIKSVLTFFFLTLQATNAFSDQPRLSDDYLLGRWTTGEKEDCSSDQVVYVFFQDTHTLESGMGDTVDTVGFWRIENDRVIAHLLVAPSPARRAHPFFQEKFHYEYKSPRILETQPDRFVYTHDVTHDTNIPEANLRTLTRCM